MSEGVACVILAEQGRVSQQQRVPGKEQSKKHTLLASSGGRRRMERGTARVTFVCLFVCWLCVPSSPKTPHAFLYARTASGKGFLAFYLT